MMSIKTSSIDWDEVKKTSGLVQDENIRYEILEYETGKIRYYQRILIEPFYAKSTWTKSKPENIEKWIIGFYNSKIATKCKEIHLRDYNNTLYFDQLRDVSKAKKIDGLTVNKLYHGASTNNYDGKKVGNIWRKFTIPKLASTKELDPTKYKISDENIEKMIKDAQCYYCGVTIRQINQLAELGKLFTKRSRGYTMEIDQIDAFGGYTDKNCVACCYWCNNAKTDEFIKAEFKTIAARS